MSLIEIFRAVFTNILANKFRVFLTALGIIVGSLTIILVVGIGKGSQASVEEQFARLNVGTLYVMSSPGSKSADALTTADLKAVQEQASSLNASTITVTGKAEASYYNTSYSSSVLGVLDDFQTLNNLKLEYGEFIRSGDSESRKKIAVIGADLADILFEGEKSEAVGKTISIDKRKYEVVGILARLGDSMQGMNIDESLLIPYETATKYVLGTQVKPRIIAIAKDLDNVPTAIEEIEAILKQTHRGKNSGDFVVRDAGSKLAAAKDSAKTMSILLIAVAAIVLIVGGIGIMNVLFVSIKERTREIGILKAIGARRSDILLQFLFESIIISASGGLLGIVLGIITMPLMKYADIQVISSLYGNILALVFSIATGTFFGYYPAAKASTLRPIDALSYE
jgi:putative ABC transport system permease protein